MQLKSVFALLAAGTFLVACGSDEVVNINDEAKDKATITIKVMDNHDGSAIDGASVLSVVDNKTKTSDKNGLAVWKGRILGDHVFQVSKDGYSTIQVKASLEEKGQGNVARVPDVVSYVYMYKADVTAKGSVLYTDDKGNMNAASGVTVYASLPAKFVPSELTAETDKNGEYKFESLPEGTEIEISVGQKTIDKLKYAAEKAYTIGDETYRSGDVINVNIINMTKVAGQLELVSSNLNKVDSNSTLTLTFSTELAADSVKGKWSVTGNGNSQMVTASLNSDKKTIAIKLVDGVWSKTASYTVSGTAVSAEGARRSVEKTFRVGGSGSSAVPENVTIKVAADEDYPKTRAVITWTAPKTATGYTLWYKNLSDKTMEAYAPVSTSYYNIDRLDCEITVYLSYLGEEGEKIAFKLIPSNSNGSADVAGAKAAEYTIPKDEPVIIPPSSSSTTIIPSSDDEEPEEDETI